MKTPILHTVLIAGALAVGPVQGADSNKPSDQKTLGEKTSETIDKAVDKTKDAGRAVADKSKEAGRAVVDGTKKAAGAVKDAVTPDADARKVDVTLNEHKIDMPMSVPAGKTAFVVRNAGKEQHNFEIRGESLDKKFWMAVDPNDTKTLNVELKPGSYKVICPIKGHEAKGMETTLTVK